MGKAWKVGFYQFFHPLEISISKLRVQMLFVSFTPIVWQMKKKWERRAMAYVFLSFCGSEKARSLTPILLFSYTRKKSQESYIATCQNTKVIRGTEISVNLDVCNLFNWKKNIVKLFCDFAIWWVPQGGHVQKLGTLARMEKNPCKNFNERRMSFSLSLYLLSERSK